MVGYCSGKYLISNGCTLYVSEDRLDHRQESSEWLPQFILRTTTIVAGMVSCKAFRSDSMTFTFGSYLAFDRSLYM